MTLHDAKQALHVAVVAAPHDSAVDCLITERRTLHCLSRPE